MSNQKLWVIANATNEDASFVNTVGDTGNCPANRVTHTGGKDGNYIQIPDCSGSEWFREHHIVVKGLSWEVSFWANDKQDGKLYWSPSENYYDGNPLEGSDTSENSCLLIALVNGQPKVYWSAF